MSSQASKRLTKEYKHLIDNPVDLIQAHPSESNILEWHYIITGPKDTPYEDGQYHGILMFPPQYPFKPPGIKVITPNGRFQSNTRICLSMSDYHPETWNPAWKVSTILTALLSFMTSNEIASGCVNTNDATKLQLAKNSFAWNKTNPVFQKQFPDLMNLKQKPATAPISTPKVDASSCAKQTNTDLTNLDNHQSKNSKNDVIEIIDDNDDGDDNREVVVLDEVHNQKEKNTNDDPIIID